MHLHDDLYQASCIIYICMSRKHDGGMATMTNKMMLFATLVGRTEQFEAHQASFSLISTYSLCLRVAQMPRCQDLAILVVTTDR